MSAKAEAKAAPAAAPEGKSGGGAMKSLIPALAAMILAPAMCWGVAEFVLLPRLQAKLGGGEPAEAATAHAEPAAESGGGHGKSEKKGEGAPAAGGSYEFSNVVVNLAGTMGTRYLKTSFVVVGADPKANVVGLFETQKPQLTDITLSVLSALTLADLEEPGSKNILRERLVGAYNQAFGKRVVAQVYFSDFVVQ